MSAAAVTRPLITQHWSLTRVDLLTRGSPGPLASQVFSALVVVVLVAARSHAAAAAPPHTRHVALYILRAVELRRPVDNRTLQVLTVSSLGQPLTYI